MECGLRRLALHVVPDADDHAPGLLSRPERAGANVSHAPGSPSPAGSQVLVSAKRSVTGVHSLRRVASSRAERVRGHTCGQHVLVRGNGLPPS